MPATQNPLLGSISVLKIVLVVLDSLLQSLGSLLDRVIVRVDLVHDDMVPHFAQNRPNFVVVPSSTEWRPHESRVNANDSVDSVGELLHLIKDGFFGQVGERSVAPSVRSNNVSISDGLADDVDVLGDLALVVSVL